MPYASLIQGSDGNFYGTTYNGGADPAFSGAYGGTIFKLAVGPAPATAPPCTASGAWSGSEPASGSFIAAPTTAGTYTYTLTCTSNTSQVVSQNVTLTVTAAATPPGVTIAANPSSVVLGNSSTLTWSSTNATACTATVQPGLGQGRYGAPVVHHYTIAGLTDPTQCPDMGVALSRPFSSIDDLAVTWFVTPPQLANSVYVLRNFIVLTSSSGEQLPSYVGSQDFNGDGRGDLWESTDQDEQFTTLLRQGTGFVPGPATFYTIQALPPLAFGHLDNTPGTDLVAAFNSPDRDQPGLPGTTGTGVLVVFGKTGKKVLLELDPSGQTSYTPTLLDANHDGHLDVKVTGGSKPPRIYLGDGAGHFKLAS